MMTYYLLRRVVYAIPILLGINVITFALFFMVNSPDDMARMQLGQKYVKPAAIMQWKVQRGYDLPLFYNVEKTGLKQFTETLFSKNRCVCLLLILGFPMAAEISVMIFPIACGLV